MKPNNKWTETLKDFSSLWKTDDPAWIKERKQQWRTLARGCLSKLSAREKKQYAEYFVTGKTPQEPNPLSGLPEDVYINETRRFFLTPFDSAEVMNEFFWSQGYTFKDRFDILGGYPWKLLRLAEEGEVPWLREHIEYFARGLLGDEYRLLKAEGGRERVYSPDPSFWCVQYVIFVERALKGGADPAFTCMQFLDYFVSSLKYVNKEKITRFDSLGYVFEKVDGALAAGGESNEVVSLCKELKAREAEARTNWDAAQPFDVRFG